MEKGFKGRVNAKLNIDYSHLTDVIDEKITELVVAFLQESVDCIEQKDTEWKDWCSTKDVEFDSGFVNYYESGDYYNPPVNEIEMTSNIPTDEEILNYIIENIVLHVSELFSENDITLELSDNIDDIEFDCEEEYDPLDDDRKYDEWKERGLCE